MKDILQVKGNVKFPIYLDPGTWIFDDRKFDLDTWHPEIKKEENQAQETYLKQVSSQWDKEIIEGASPPPSEPVKKTKKQQLTENSFGIVLKPFFLNTEPNSNSTTVIVHTEESDFTYSLEEALQMVAGFSIKGRPIKADEGGPIHLYHGDGSNRQAPIKNVTGFTIQ
jgi:hypothetical protein